jgi:hypothetical protein
VTMATARRWFAGRFPRHPLRQGRAKWPFRHDVAFDITRRVKRAKPEIN